MIHVPISDLIRVFGKIGLLSFGGPAAQIALMHKELVEDHAWVSEQQFLSALSFCMLLPGPEAMQLATFSGWRLRGVAGGLIAGILFVLPGACVITALAIVYAYFGTVPLVESAFLGIKAAVVIIVVQALLKLSQKALHSRFDYGLAVLAFVSIFLFALPFPVLIASAAVIGLIWAPARPLSPPMPPGHDAASSASQTVRTVLFWGGLWGGPLLGLWLSGNTFLTTIGLFFSKLALVTFGGAYAVLAYMTQTVVTQFEWLSTTQMIDALGLAETTPGPLILVTQFVAMQAGFKTGSLGLALAAGGIALWMTFIPCFLWVFAGAPYFDRLSQKPNLTAALSGVTAAIIGVIMNLSLWFALHIWFESNTMHSFGPIQILVPELQTLVPASLALTAIAAWALLKRRIGMATVLCSMAALGSAASFTNLI
jgi:chromate transporter